jgi:hypothetical protein
MSGSGTPPREGLQRGWWVPHVNKNGKPIGRGRRIEYPPATKKIVNQMEKEYYEKNPNGIFLSPLEFMPEEKFIPPPNSPRRNRQYRPNYMKPRPLLRLTENQMPRPLVFNNENDLPVPIVKRARNTQKRKNRKNKTRKSRN